MDFFSLRVCTKQMLCTGFLPASSARCMNQACAQFFRHALTCVIVAWFLMSCVFLKRTKNDLRRTHSLVLTSMSLLRKARILSLTELRTGNPLGPGVSVIRLIFFYSIGNNWDPGFHAKWASYILAWIWCKTQQLRLRRRAWGYFWSQKQWWCRSFMTWNLVALMCWEDIWGGGRCRTFGATWPACSVAVNGSFGKFQHGGCCKTLQPRELLRWVRAPAELCLFLSEWKGWKGQSMAL